MNIQPGACFLKALHPAGAHNKSLISNTGGLCVNIEVVTLWLFYMSGHVCKYEL